MKKSDSNSFQRAGVTDTGHKIIADAQRLIVVMINGDDINSRRLR